MADRSPHVFAVIMAGGGGTRFWPLSRRGRPKQFLNITGSRSLLQTTWDRALEVVDGPEDILVVTATGYDKLTREQLPELTRDNLLLEPQARNTAPCIAWATAEIAGRDADAVTVVMPADHLIADLEAFRSSVDAAVRCAVQYHSLVTFGVPPRYPETGYGYIETGDEMPIDGAADGIEVYRVNQFREKPDLPTAESYVAAGNFLWNGGIFVWTVADINEALQEQLPEARQAADRMIAAGEADEQAAAYAAMPATSIDFGVMERASNVATVKAPFDWSDIGSWAALREVSDNNAGNNVAFGPVIHIDSVANLVHAPDCHVALVGVDNLAVVYTGDVLLVASLDRSQDIKLLRERLKDSGLEDLL